MVPGPPDSLTTTALSPETPSPTASMASSTTTDSYVYERRVTEKIHRYQWPAWQLNLWMLIMLIASCCIIGVFSTFIQTQQTLGLPVPWYALSSPPPSIPQTNPFSPRYFPYYITVASLVVAFIILLLSLIYQRRLLPSIVLIGAFILFILWLVGLIVVSVQLWGPTGSVSGNCNLFVFGANPQPHGQNVQALAWLQQRSICQSWQAVFAFGLVGAIFLLWIMTMAYQVFAGER